MTDQELEYAGPALYGISTIRADLGELDYKAAHGTAAYETDTRLAIRVRLAIELYRAGWPYPEADVLDLAGLEWSLRGLESELGLV